MKTIDVLSINNIKLNYELASLSDRVLAFIIDYIIIGLFLLLSYFVLFSTFQIDELLFNVFVMLPILGFYNLFMESFFKGQSIGKKIMKIKVIQIFGEDLGFKNYLIRWVFRLIDIGLSIGGVAIISISITNNSQRIGDISSNTILVKLKPKNKVSLEDLLKIKSIKNDKVIFDNVKYLKEEDVILIKSTIVKYNKYKNSTYKNLVIELASQIKSELDIESNQNDLEFLKIIVKDYILLTR